jgi:hypothetical protein
LDPFGEVDRSIWENLWAHIILSQDELTEYRSIEDKARRASWLGEKAITKDAMRMWVRRRTGRELYPADLETTNQNGRLQVTGPWQHEVEAPERVSIARGGPVTVAAVGNCGLGVEIEPVAQWKAGAETAVFDSTELAHFSADNGPQRDEWLARACCAKKAAAKALDIAAHDSQSLKRLVIRGLHLESGEVTVDCNGGEGSGDSLEMVVPTMRDGNNIIALAVSRIS